MRKVCFTFVVILLGAACVAAQEPAGGSQGRATVSTGDRTVVGCVAMGGTGYVLNTDDGNTLPLRSATDLSQYVGKRVEIHATWTSTGVHLAGPLETTGAAAAPAASPGAGGGAQEFAGDIHLQLRGKVIGDCLGKK